MRRLPVILFLFLAARAKAQAPPSAYTRLDTLDTYNVSLRSETGSGVPPRYYVNDEPVRQIVYEAYKRKWDNIVRCTPCFLRTYDTEDNLLYEGVQYTDCALGPFVEYYPSGGVKVRGQYRENTTGDWTNFFARGLCSVREAVWTYYTTEGKVLKRETYRNGVLVP